MQRPKPRRCCVPSCTASYPLQSVHLFPKPPLRSIWAKILGVPEEEITNQHYVCSEHFEPNDIVITSKGVSMVRPFAIPSPVCKVQYEKVVILGEMTEETDYEILDKDPLHETVSRNSEIGAEKIKDIATEYVHMDARTPKRRKAARKPLKKKCPAEDSNVTRVRLDIKTNQLTMAYLIDVDKHDDDDDNDDNDNDDDKHYQMPIKISSPSSDIEYKSDTSKCSSIVKTKPRSLMLDEVFDEESDTTASITKSTKVSLIPLTTMNDYDSVNQKLDSNDESNKTNKSISSRLLKGRNQVFHAGILSKDNNTLEEEPFSDSGSEFIPGADESDEEIAYTRDLENPSATIDEQDEIVTFRNDTDTEVCTEELCQQDSFLNQDYGEKPSPCTYPDNIKKDEVHLASITTGKRTYDKKLLVTKLPRHLEAKHKNEKEVAQFMAEPLNSKERKTKIESIRQTGNYLHNSEAITSGTGLVIPKRRPATSKNIKDFTPCGYCHGFFDKKYIYVHKKQCAEKHSFKVTNKAAGKLTVAEEVACKGLQQDVLSKMRQDNLYHVVRADSLILRFGSELYNRLGNLEHLHVYIAQRMRQLARYLTEIRNINDEVHTLADSLHPKYFNDFVHAVKCLGKYNKKTETYDVPTLPLRLRTSIQQCATIYKSDSIIKGQVTKIAQLDDFVSLIEMNYRNQVSSQALNSACKRKWNKPEMDPRCPKGKKTKNGTKIQKQRKQFKRVAWTPKEKDAMNRKMAVFWLRKKVPNKKECDACLAQEPDLSRRSWRDVKNYVYNVIKKAK